MKRFKIEEFIPILNHINCHINSRVFKSRYSSIYSDLVSPCFISKILLYSTYLSVTFQGNNYKRVFKKF